MHSFNSSFLFVLFIFPSFYIIAQESESINEPTASHSEVYKLVDEMPRFLSGNCEELQHDYQKKTCSDQALTSFIEKELLKLKIPEFYETEGMILANFIVSKNGSLKDLRITRSVHPNLDSAVLDVFILMNETGLDWILGKNKGELVNVEINFPIRLPFERNNIDLVPMKAPIQPDSVFKIVHEMPRFPGCEGMANDQERKQCAGEELLKYKYSNLKYPSAARAAEIEGTVVVSFIVEKNGSLSEVMVVRDIGYGCGEETVNMVNKMTLDGIRWRPGYHDGEPVRVQFNMPVKFVLD